MPFCPLVRATLGVPGEVSTWPCVPWHCPHFSGTLGVLGSRREAGRLPEAPSPRHGQWEDPG